MGSFGKRLLVIREQMGIRTNGDLVTFSLHEKQKWEPICSRTDCTAHEPVHGILAAVVFFGFENTYKTRGF